MMLRITQKPSQKSLNLPLQHFPSNYRFHIWDTLDKPRPYGEYRF
jgi:hypothetical protein